MEMQDETMSSAGLPIDAHALRIIRPTADAGKLLFGKHGRDLAAAFKYEEWQDLGII